MASGRTGTHLYDALADLYLRAAGHWSGGGKIFARQLLGADAPVATELEETFWVLFAQQDDGRLQEVADAILLPYGGRLWAGYRADAPAAWKR